MIAEPKPAYYRAGPETIAVLPTGGELAGELFIECVVTDPPSSAGRTLYLRVQAEQVPAILRAARQAAIDIRSEPEGAGGIR